MLTYHTAIIGAGASGLFCAGSFSTPKIILDHNKFPGVKVGLSGGGKCNFTNLHLRAEDYLCQQRHFCKSALAAFTPHDFVRLLEEANIPYEARNHGQLFAQNAQDIVRFLVKRAKAANTDFSLNTQVLNIEKTADGFVLRTSSGLLKAQHVVLATGGLSYPALGASPFGWKLARQLGLTMVEPQPALCGLTAPKELRACCKQLAGNSTLATVKVGKHIFTEKLLFTHEGISGPAVLSVSLYWKEGETISVNFLPNINVPDLLNAHKQTNQKISSIVHLPGKMAQTLLGALDQPLANITKNTLQAAIQRLQAFEFIPAGTSGYSRAEVTAGGVNTLEINPKTFEVKKSPGLYIIGELLDVTGQLGGFNLHWAWASGYGAGMDLSKKF